MTVTLAHLRSEPDPSVVGHFAAIPPTNFVYNTIHSPPFTAYLNLLNLIGCTILARAVTAQFLLASGF